MQVSGQDAKKFLQGQLTCNVEEISPTQTRLGAHCNPQGRILSLFRLFFYHDSYYLQMPQEMLAPTMTALKKYAVFFKATLSDASDSLVRIGYCGELAEIDKVLIIKLPGDTLRYEIIGAPTAIPKAITQHKHITANEWKYFDIHAGIPAIYPETIEKFLPHEINLHQLDGISFNKGCYTGQEIIARMHYRGKLKTHLYRAKVKTNSPPKRGSDIYRQKESAGSLVDYCQLSYNTYELLVIAQETDAQENTLMLDPMNKDHLEFLDFPK